MSTNVYVRECAAVSIIGIYEKLAPRDYPHVRERLCVSRARSMTIGGIPVGGEDLEGSGLESDRIRLISLDELKLMRFPKVRELRGTRTSITRISIEID